MATMKKAMSGARTFLEHEGRRTLHEATRGEYVRMPEYSATPPNSGDSSGGRMRVRLTAYSLTCTLLTTRGKLVCS